MLFGTSPRSFVDGCFLRFRFGGDVSGDDQKIAGALKLSAMRSIIAVTSTWPSPPKGVRNAHLVALVPTDLARDACCGSEPKMEAKWSLFLPDDVLKPIHRSDSTLLCLDCSQRGALNGGMGWGQ